MTTKNDGGAWWREPTRDQWVTFGAAWIGWILDAFDFTVFLLAMPLIAREFGVSTTAAAGSITLTLLTRLVGGLAAGAAADRWGRKLPLMISLVWLAVFDGLDVLAPSFAALLVVRTLFGLGMGAEWTAGTTLAMENWPARSRGIASGILQGSWAIGYLFAALAFAIVVPIWGWRALFVLAVLPALLALPIRYWVPESPEWLARKKESAARPTATPPLRPLLAKLVWGSLTMALGFGVYYALTGVYPTMLAQERGLDAGAIAMHVGLFNAGTLVGSVVAGTTASRWGTTAAIAVPAMLMVPLLPLYVGDVAGASTLGAFLGGAVGVGFCGTVPMLLTDLFPPEVRARAVGLVYHVGSLFAALVPVGISLLSELSGLRLATSIAIVAGVLEIALAAVFVLSRKRSPAPDGVLVVQPS